MVLVVVGIFIVIVKLDADEKLNEKDGVELVGSSQTRLFKNVNGREQDWSLTDIQGTAIPAFWTGILYIIIVLLF